MYINFFEKSTKKIKRLIMFGIHLCNIKNQYRPSRDCIEIDITTTCNLKCYNCNRSCRQAPVDEHISVEQITKFINESIKQNRKWKRIRLMGGEPTLHPQIFEIINLLISYKKEFSHKTKIILTTNGFGSEVNAILAKLDKIVKIEDTRKDNIINDFYSFNEAPIDFIQYRNANFSRGCEVVELCGMGLTRYGYYPCAVSGGIDRVFGFDYGRKKLPNLNDSMKDIMGLLCQYCGIFKWDYLKMTKKEKISPSWELAYKNFRVNKPRLTLY